MSASIDVSKWENFVDSYLSAEDRVNIFSQVAPMGITLRPNERRTIISEKSPKNVKGSHGPYQIGLIKSLFVAASSPLLRVYLELDRADQTWNRTLMEVYDVNPLAPPSEIGYIMQWGYLSPIFGLIYLMGFTPQRDWSWKKHIIFTVFNSDVVNIRCIGYGVATTKLVRRKTDEELAEES